MAQLKLMKKEWFDWFKNTTLDNITAWTEYYYINPDSQHWISNNIIDIDVNDPTNNYYNNFKYDNGIMEVIQDVSSGAWFRFKLKSPIPKGTTLTFNNFGDPFNYNKLGISKGTGMGSSIYWYVMDNNVSYTTTDEVNYIQVALYPVDSVGHKFKPNLVIGTTPPIAFDPHLIKIENIVGVYNLGDLTWQHQNMNTEHDRFGSGSLQGIIKNVSSGNVKGYIFSNHFVTDTSNNVYNHVNDNAIAVTNNGFILIYSSEYASITGAEFKSLVDGDYIVVMKEDSPY